jgi:hypothetical protein
LSHGGLLSAGCPAVEGGRAVALVTFVL